MLETLLQLDREITLWINQHYSEFADIVMEFLSGRKVWIPLYLLFIYGVYRATKSVSIDTPEPSLLGRNSKRKKLWLSVTVIIALCVAAVGLADYSSVHLFKNVFLRLRPCFEPDLEGLLRFYIGESSSKHLYGFVSSHAANVFALAAFLTPVLRRYKVVGYGGIYLWAALVGYSRIYLGKHYLGDVICGAALGFAIGTAMYCLCKWVLKKVAVIR
ncbi:MAG: phosphatase PAP2 family protein [Bacteroidales bacterium]|jgi:undecaprenyl-diphosphatase|nr:phosphatase PAP2 family protein [Bacteroidales bacterium]